MVQLPFPNSPTGTTGIRKAFATEIRKAFRNKLKTIYKQLQNNAKQEGVRFKEAQVKPSDIELSEKLMENLRYELSPIVMRYIQQSWLHGNKYAAKTMKRGEFVPFDRRVLLSLQQNTYKYLFNFVESKQKDLMKILREGIQEGMRAKDVADTIKQSFKTTSWKSEQIARTEVVRTHGQSTKTAIKSAGVTKEYRWLTSKKENVCKVCAPLHGRIFQVDDPNAPMPVEDTHPNCFIDKQIPILTIEGYKQIGDIKIGDLVLTKEGKFRKVTELYFDKYYKGDVITLEWGTSNIITVTPEHPVMTRHGYKKAEDLALEDEIMVKNNDDEFEFTYIKLKNIIKKPLKRNTRLYNFEVDEFNNYIAKGIVFHNCNCGVVPYVRTN